MSLVVSSGFGCSIWLPMIQFGRRKNISFHLYLHWTPLVLEFPWKKRTVIFLASFVTHGICFLVFNIHKYNHTISFAVYGCLLKWVKVKFCIQINLTHPSKFIFFSCAKCTTLGQPTIYYFKCNLHYNCTHLASLSFIILLIIFSSFCSFSFYG